LLKYFYFVDLFKEKNKFKIKLTPYKKPIRYFIIVNAIYYIFKIKFLTNILFNKLIIYHWFFFSFFKKFYKFFNMLHVGIQDYIFISYYILTIFFITFSYFKYNTVSILIKSSSKDTRYTKNLSSKKNYNFFFFKNTAVNIVLLFIHNFLYRGSSEPLLSDHIFITETCIYIIGFILVLAVFVINILYNLSLSKLYFSVDFLYVLSMIFIILNILFLSNTFFTFYFILELTVCLVFFKFAVSRFWFRNPLKIYSVNSLEKFSGALPKNHLNVLFYQYWVSFFSSIMLLFFFINLEFFFSSTEWTFINLLLLFGELPNSFYFYFFIFIISFFLKIGAAPFHLYKIEVYKGLPFITIFIYTIIFFSVYFLYFVILLLNNMTMFYVYYWISLSILIILGIFYLIFLLFDINFLKNFFAYSTIINLVSFICILLSTF